MIHIEHDKIITERVCASCSMVHAVFSSSVKLTSEDSSVLKSSIAPDVMPKNALSLRLHSTTTCLPTMLFMPVMFPAMSLSAVTAVL